MRELIIKSAVPLTDSQKKRLEKGFRQADTSEELTFKYLIDSIVGGIIVVDGEDVYDASFLTGLKKIKEDSAKLLKAEKNGISVKDIPALLAAKIAERSVKAPTYEHCGRVISAADGVIRVSGLDNCRYGELLLAGEKGFALAMNLERDEVGAIVLSDVGSVGFGDYVYTTGKIIEVPVGAELFGRVINPLGQPLDEGKEITADETRYIESPAPAIIDRQKVAEPLETGILAIDAMVPIGRGQRELIIGDRQTGKTSIAVDTIINQKGKGVYCVYVAIGQRAAGVGKVINTLKKYGAMEYTTVVLTTPNDSAPLQYIAPYTGAAIGEYLMSKGKDVLIVYDDLSKHAVAYRAISLLLKRPAGREAYPGDVFYIHSRLLERSAKLSAEAGGGSMTALPIIETLAGDISAYIPTNVISITDGQIYLESELFNAGSRPAVNVGLSVSRVGGQAQKPIIRKLSSALRLEIAHFRELAVFAQFGSSLGDTTKDILENGVKTVEALKQNECEPMSSDKEAVYLYAITKGFLKKIPHKEVQSFLSALYKYFVVKQGALLRVFREKGSLDAKDERKINEAIANFVEEFLARGE